jgi:hypothetical protein
MTGTRVTLKGDHEENLKIDVLVAKTPNLSTFAHICFISHTVKSYKDIDTSFED